MSIAIVTDSTADIPFDLAVQQHIHRPQYHRNRWAEPGRWERSRYEFYERLPNLKHPPRRRPSSGTYETLYETLFAQGANIISIHASSLLSGIYNAAHTATPVIRRPGVCSGQWAGIFGTRLSGSGSC
jgi:fatty acid-binding protein DegV